MKYDNDLLKIVPPDFIDPFEPKPCPCCGKRPEIDKYHRLEQSYPVFDFRCPTTKKRLFQITLVSENDEPIAVLNWNVEIFWEEITKVIALNHKIYEAAHSLGPVDLNDFKEELRETMFPFWVAKAARTAIYVKEKEQNAG